MTDICAFLREPPSRKDETMTGTTPGPWTIEKISFDIGGQTSYIVAENGPEICEMTRAVPKDTAEANAALIASAPDLLAACQWAITEWFDRVYPPDIFVGGPKSDAGVNEVREVAERLRAAIKRAEGRE